MGQVVMTTTSGNEKVRLSRDTLVVRPADSDETSEEAEVMPKMSCRDWCEHTL